MTFSKVDIFMLSMCFGFLLVTIFTLDTDHTDLIEKVRTQEPIKIEKQVYMCEQVAL